jgi:signal transduction histidine kinase
MKPGSSVLPWRRVQWNLRDRPMQTLNLATLVALVSSILYISSIILIFRRRQYRPRAAPLAILYGLCSFLWALELALYQLGALDMLLPEFLYQVPLFGIYLLSILFLLITQSILGANHRPGLWLGAGILWGLLPILIGSGFLPIPMTLEFRGGYQLTRQALTSLLIISGWAVFMGAATVITIQAIRRSSRFSTIGSYWAFVLLLAVLGDGSFFAGFIVIGMLLRLVSTLLAVYVFTAPRIPEISHILRQSLSFVLSSSIAIAIYAVIFTGMQFIFPNQTALGPFWIGLMLALVLVLAINPLLELFKGYIQNWFSGEGRDPTEMLRQYSQSITNILDFNLLATVAIGTASEFLEVKRGFLFLVENEKGDGGTHFNLRGVKGMGDTNPISSQLSESSTLATYFRNELKPITRQDIDWQTRFRDISDEERTWLNNLGTEVFVPIYAKNEWIGLLTLGPKSSGLPYTSQDMALLSTMGDQTAVALENTRLVEGLVRLNNDFRRAYAALDQANRSLERLDKTKSDFISIASHELRTPLTLISGASQMLLDDPDLQQNPYYKQMLNKINTGTIRLHEIVESMLDMAKIDTRDLELAPQPVALASLIQAVVNDLKKDATERKQSIDIKHLDNLPPIAADLQALRKVFRHIVVNAIKYTPDGGTITVSGKELPPGGEFPKGGVEIVISDTGIGIDPRFQELIFAKFYQTGELALHSSGKTKFKGGGPGLGLAIARGIVEAHRGKIWAESPGYDETNCPGSHFHVILPLRMADRPQPPQDVAFT